MVITQTIWAPMPTPEQRDACRAKAAEMQAEGKTDNVPTATYPYGDGGCQVTLRSWTTQADAEEWAAFLVAYSPWSNLILPDLA